MSIWRTIRDAALRKIRDPRTIRDAAFGVALWIVRRLIKRGKVT